MTTRPTHRGMAWPKSTAGAQLRASEIAARYGLSSRYWIKMAAAGRIPGAWQPSGPGGAWLFDKAQFVAWREARKRRAPAWPRSTAGEQGIGPGPNVRGASIAAASGLRIGQLLNDVLGDGSTNSTPSPTATSPGGPGRKRRRSSSGSTSPRLSVVRPFDTA